MEGGHESCCNPEKEPRSLLLAATTPGKTYPSSLEDAKVRQNDVDPPADPSLPFSSSASPLTLNDPFNHILHNTDNNNDVNDSTNYDRQNKVSRIVATELYDHTTYSNDISHNTNDPFQHAIYTNNNPYIINTMDAFDPCSVPS